LDGGSDEENSFLGMKLTDDDIEIPCIKDKRQKEKLMLLLKSKSQVLSTGWLEAMVSDKESESRNGANLVDDNEGFVKLSALS
jgi:hypothetical protein